VHDRSVQQIVTVLFETMSEDRVQHRLVIEAPLPEPFHRLEGVSFQVVLGEVVVEVMP
jgi:hypothetical protein